MALVYGLSFLVAAIAFAFALYLYLWVKKHKVENEKIKEVSKLIKDGAKTFIAREYKILAIFASIAAVIVLVLLPKPIWQNAKQGW